MNCKTISRFSFLVLMIVAACFMSVPAHAQANICYPDYIYTSGGGIACPGYAGGSGAIYFPAGDCDCGTIEVDYYSAGTDPIFACDDGFVCEYTGYIVYFTSICANTGQTISQLVEIFYDPTSPLLCYYVYDDCELCYY